MAQSTTSNSVKERFRATTSDRQERKDSTTPMTTCGHECCAIPDNGCHQHQASPTDCRRCAATRVARGETSESMMLARVVADVLAHIAPEIPQLPDGPELAELVASAVLAEYASAVVDPEFLALDERGRRSALSARVGLALAFPTA